MYISHFSIIYILFINNGIENCVSAWSQKQETPDAVLLNWKYNLMEIVNNNYYFKNTKY